jgi:hypothetical protein
MTSSCDLCGRQLDPQTFPGASEEYRDVFNREPDFSDASLGRCCDSCYHDKVLPKMLTSKIITTPEAVRALHRAAKKQDQ